jgi:hypothetical protein
MSLLGEVKAWKVLAEAADGTVQRLRVHDFATHEKLAGIGGLLHGVSYDSVAITYPTSTSEIYSFLTGGLSGSQVAVVTLIYQSSSKTNLVSAVKT